MHSTQKSVIINKAICRFKHEEKEDEFHAKRMESIQPLKWKEQKETVSMSAQYIHDTGQRIYGNGGNSRSGESGSGDTGRYNPVSYTHLIDTDNRRFQNSCTKTI